jgi:hypothetical protein
MIIKDFAFGAASEGGDHPERARTSSADLTIQMPVSGDLRPTGTRVPLWAKDGTRITALETLLPILHKMGRDLEPCQWFIPNRIFI